MHACLGIFLPEDMQGNTFHGLLVCARGCLSTRINQHTSGARNEDTLVPGSKMRSWVVLLTVSSAPASESGFRCVVLACRVGTSELGWFQAWVYFAGSPTAPPTR